MRSNPLPYISFSHCENTEIFNFIFSTFNYKYAVSIVDFFKYLCYAKIHKGMISVTKDTSKIVEELGLCPDFTTFYDENKQYLITDTLSEMLEELLSQKGLKKSAVIKSAELSEVYGYQIFSGLRVPERNKLLCLAVAMRLNIDEVQTLLKAAGYSQLYVKLPFDSIVLYGICKGLSVVDINELLYEYGLKTLG